MDSASRWVVFAGCEDGSAQTYLKSVVDSKTESKGSSRGAFAKRARRLASGCGCQCKITQQYRYASRYGSRSCQVLDAVDIKEYEAFGIKGYMGTGAMNMDMSVQFSSPDAKMLSYLTKDETSKMITRLQGDPILVAQQGFDIQKQMDLLLKSDAMIQEQYDAGKAEFKSNGNGS